MKNTDRFFQRCSRCVMDTTDPEIVFSSDGTCNHCNQLIKDRLRFHNKSRNKQILDNIVNEIKRSGRKNKYDCIVGVSGGVDSTYVAYLVKQLGLRPLAVHLDNGWNSELAVHNIQRALEILGIDLQTVVLDWQEFRGLQKAFLRASVTDAEIPTDHAIRAALWKIASKNKVKYIINGRNHSTEGILPWSWTYNALDWKYISSINKKFGNEPLRKFPHFNLPTMLWKVIVSRHKNIGILDYVEFEKNKVIEVLRDKLGWRDYGGKHYESIYTRFFQGFILPEKFGVDKRKAHLSVLICSGQITREEALAELEKQPLSNDILLDDKEFVLQKLGISDVEFAQIMSKPTMDFSDYPNNSWIFMMHENPTLIKFARILRKLGILPKGFGDNLLAENSHETEVPK